MVVVLGPARRAGRPPECGSGCRPHIGFRTFFQHLTRLNLLGLALVFLAVSPSEAQEDQPPVALAPGDLAVSGFSGTKLATPTLPAGVSPVDKTVIDPDAPALSVYDLSTMGGPPEGQVISPVVKFKVPAKDVGQVYSLVFDPGKDGLSPSLYSGATSAFGLNIVGGKPGEDGSPVRLKQGETGAKFMEGQFGGLDGASPGAIWKIDGATGEASLLADTAFTGTQNSGPGIGGLALDPASRNLYTSDLDTGLIHRFGLDYNAANLGQFDHGVLGRPSRGLSPMEDDGKRADITSTDFKADDPATWGFTQDARRVRALTVQGGRLYYSVDEGPEIWSVGLGPDGAFAEDARSELAVETDQPVVVSSIAFDAKGNMILGVRRPLKASYDYSAFIEPGAAKPLRYTQEIPDDPATPGFWALEAATYNVGTGPGNEGGAGGASPQYAYGPFGNIDVSTCNASIAFSVEGIAEDGSGHGAQVGAIGAVEPEDAPATSALIDFDPMQSKAELLGHVGDVEAFQNCTGGAGGYPPIAGGGGFPPIFGGGGGFPPIAGGGGGGAFPPVAGGGGGFPPVVEGGGGKGTTAPGPSTTRSGNLAVTKQGLSPDCSEATTCNYTITVENLSDTIMPGPIVVEDTLSAGDAALAAAKITQMPGPPWACTAAPPKFTCIHQAPIAAKATVPLTIGFAPGPIGAAPEIKNCVVPVSLPAEKIPMGPGTTIKGGLQFTLVPLTSKCRVAVETDSCEWEAKITNVGAETVTGPAELQFLYSYNYPTFGLTTGISAIKSQSAPAGTSCAIAGNVVKCSNPQFSIAPKETKSIRIMPVLNTSRPEDIQKTQSLTGDLTASVGGAGEASLRTNMKVDTPAAIDPPPPLAPTSRPDGEFKAESTPVSGKCSVAAGSCEWDLKFSNTGAAPLTGTLSFTQFFLYRDVDANSRSVAPTTPLSTTSTPPVTCDAPTRPNEISCRADNFTLAASQSFTVRTRVKFDPPAADKNAIAVTAAITASLAGKGSSAESSLLLDEPVSTGGGGGGAGGGGAAGGANAPAGGAAGGAGGAAQNPQTPPTPACVMTPTAPQAAGAGGQPGGAGGGQPGGGAKPENKATTGPIAIEKVGVSPTCKEGAPCTFKVTVTNTSDKPISFPLEFMDEPSVGGAILDADLSGGWNCGKGAKGVPCSRAGPFLPNTPVSGEVTFTPGPLGNATEVNNCAVMQPLNIAKDGTPMPNDTLEMARDPLKLTTQAVTPACPPDTPCEFKVTLTNTSAVPVTGALTTFVMTGASAGANFGGSPKTELVSSVTPPGTTCKQADVAGRSIPGCTNPNFTIAPGASVDLSMTIKYAPPANTPGPVDFAISQIFVQVGDKSVTNVINTPAKAGAGAAPAGPAAPARACAAIPAENPAAPPAGKLSIAKTGVAGSCKGDPKVCDFTVTVTNGTNAPINGPVEFTDDLTGDGALFGSAAVTAPAPWSCPKQGQGFKCSANLQLDAAGGAKASQSFTFSATLGAGTGAVKEMKNCATLVGEPPSCGTVDMTQAPPPPPPVLGEPKEVPLLGNLKAVITAATPECPIAGPCVFNGSLLSTGAGVPFNGQMDALTVILGGTPANVQGSGAGFACEREIAVGGAPSSTVLCKGKQETLPDGQSLPFTITVNPGGTWQKNNIVRACVDVVSAQDSNKADNKACAEAKLDPFNVKIAKTGDQNCQPGSECTFELDICNDQQIVHDDPVTVTDNLVGLQGAEIVSISAANDPFPCSPTPDSLPFSCTGKMRLDPGEHNKYTMVVKVPAAAPEQGWFSNCASIGGASAALPRPTATGGSPAPAATEMACHVVSTEPQCTGGMVKTESGECACPAGQSWDGTTCAAPKQACPPGTSGTYPDCKSLGTGGSNTTKQQDTPKPKPGTGTGGSNSTRSCPPGFEYRGGKCRCPRGLDYVNGTCRAPQKPQQPQPQQPNVCPPDRPVGTPPRCCPEGTEYSRGACRQPRQPVQPCPPGTVGRYPICVPLQQKPQEEQRPQRPDCPPGYRQLRRPNKYGAYCEEIPAPTQPCPSGWSGTYPNCQPPAPPPPPPPPPPAPPAPDPVGPSPKQVCPSYMQGTYPNCYCPSGLTGPRCDQVIVR